MSAGERVPPGQGVTKAWPILHFGAPPAVPTAEWDLRVVGAVERELHLEWRALQRLPRIAVTADFHCVTGWSHLGAAWEGVSVAHLLALAGAPSSGFVRFWDGGAYDTTVPMEIALEPDVLLADREGGAALPRERGGPLRAVVPALYGWKSCKWVRVVEVLREERLGFWEVRGYANGADPWREERLV
jgi:DMSO/TMAO reductase YedYZ molybdopterin-dependent catalytic subunit